MVGEGMARALHAKVGANEIIVPGSLIFFYSLYLSLSRKFVMKSGYRRLILNLN
jgi:hypothetical protein